MIIGSNEQFEKVIAYLPEQTQSKSPGQELVALSRVKDPKCLAIGNDSSSISYMDISKIGKSGPYKTRRKFLSELNEIAPETQKRTIDAITQLDPEEAYQTYNGGCNFLLKWFRGKVGPHHIVHQQNTKKDSQVNQQINEQEQTFAGFSSLSLSV